MIDAEYMKEISFVYSPSKLTLVKSSVPRLHYSKPLNKINETSKLIKFQINFTIVSYIIIKLILFEMDTHYALNHLQTPRCFGAFIRELPASTYN